MKRILFILALLSTTAGWGAENMYVGDYHWDGLVAISTASPYQWTCIKGSETITLDDFVRSGHLIKAIPGIKRCLMGWHTWTKTGDCKYCGLFIRERESMEKERYKP